MTKRASKRLRGELPMVALLLVVLSLILPSFLAFKHRTHLSSSYHHRLLPRERRVPVEEYSNFGRRVLRASTTESPLSPATPAAFGPVGRLDFKVVTFNILAPIYKRDEGDKNYESERKEDWVRRNTAIAKKLRETNADIICLQEFWASNEHLKRIYEDELCTPEGGYTLRECRRTSHWRSRDDGLAVLIREGGDNGLVMQDYREILFHDCGDRVAQMLLLAAKARSDSIDPSVDESLVPYQQFILVNTHLLFPHNEYSTNIRLREVTKILGFVESYKQRELCATICGRADVRVPVLLLGDLNGSPGGKVCSYMRSQNYRSAYDFTDRAGTFISHKTHTKKELLVDNVFYLNPSDQVEELLPPVPDWTDLVFRELLQKVVGEANKTMEAVFSEFNQDDETHISREAFARSLAKLGFSGEGNPTLTSEEIEILIDSADKNGDGNIDYKEFYDRFWLALNDSEQNNYSRSLKKKTYIARSVFLSDSTGKPPGGTNGVSYPFSQLLAAGARPLGDLSVKELCISPGELESGHWPADYDLSDHGMISVTFSASCLPIEPEDERIDPNPMAQKVK